MSNQPLSVDIPLPAREPARGRGPERKRASTWSEELQYRARLRHKAGKQERKALLDDVDYWRHRAEEQLQRAGLDGVVRLPRTKTVHNLRAWQALAAVGEGRLKVWYAQYETCCPPDRVLIHRVLKGGNVAGRPREPSFNVRFTAIPLEGNKVQHGFHGAMMTILFQCGEFVRALEQALVYVRAQELFGHGPGSVEVTHAQSAFAMHGMEPKFGVRDQLLALTGIAMHKLSPIRRGDGEDGEGPPKQGTKTAVVDYVEQAEYCLFELRHLYVQHRVATSDQPRFVSFSRKKH